MKRIGFRFGLRIKLVALFFLVTATLLIGVNFLWFSITSHQVRLDTNAALDDVRSHASDTVTSYFNTKILTLIIHSETDPLLKLDTSRAKTELQTYLVQDQDIQRLTIIDARGQGLMTLNREAINDTKQDLSNDPSYKVTTFLGGASYFGPVYYQNNRPYIDIAVPIVPPLQTGSLDTFSTSSVGRSRPAGEILGVLKATVTLDKLWSALKTLKVSNAGYVYAVDGKGQLIFHPNPRLLAGNTDYSARPEVAAFLAKNTDVFSTTAIALALSETNEPVLFTTQAVPGVRWGIIAQVPTSAISQSTNKAAMLAALLVAATLILVLLISLAFVEKTVVPIKLLREGSAIIGSGNFKYRIKIESHDELEELGDSFNVMAGKLEEYYSGLQDRQARLEASINSMRIGFIMTDEQFNILSLNQSAQNTFTQLEGEDTTSNQSWDLQRVSTIFSKSFDLLAQLNICIDRKQPVTLPEIDVRGKTLLIYISPIVLSGKPIGAAIAVEDITQVKVIERSKDEFFSIASHELRTPLTVIRSNASMIQEFFQSQIKDENIESMVADIHSSSERLIQIVNDFLDTSRIEQNRLQFLLQPLDIIHLASEVVRELRTLVHNKPIKLTFEPPNEKLPNVTADENRTKQILTNLIGNALKFTSSGEIKVRIDPFGDHVKVLVSDTGPGIPPDNQLLLFHKFQQLNNNPLAHDASHGTGLGLFISKALVEGMGGSIRLESSSDQGTTFSFTLPVNKG